MLNGGNRDTKMCWRGQETWQGTGIERDREREGGGVPGLCVPGCVGVGDSVWGWESFRRRDRLGGWGEMSERERLEKEVNREGRERDGEGQG